MSNLKKKLLNILYLSRIGLDSKYKKQNRNIIELNGINNKIHKKEYLSQINVKNYNLFTNSEKENNINVMNVTTIPSCPKKDKNKELTISKLSKEKYNKLRNLNITPISTSFCNNQYILSKRHTTFSNESNNNTNVKKKINIIPNCHKFNLNIVHKKLEYNKSYINTNNNNNKIKLFKSFNISQIKKLKLNKNIINKNFYFNIKKSTINNLPSIKSIYKNKLTKYYSKNDIRKLGNSKSNNKIKDKIIKMEKEFSSSELKKNLINRPMRTLNSKLFQFNSKEFKCFSPTLHILNNSRTKQFILKKNKLTNFFRERSNNNLKSIFNNKLMNLNNIYENNSLIGNRTSKAFDLSDINNKSIGKNNIFYTKINLNTNRENTQLYKEVMKYKNFYKIPVINREYQKCSKYIRNGNKTKYLKNDLLASFINTNLDYSSKSNQFSF